MAVLDVDQELKNSLLTAADSAMNYMADSHNSDINVGIRLKKFAQALSEAHYDDLSNLVYAAAQKPSDRQNVNAAIQEVYKELEKG